MSPEEYASRYLNLRALLEDFSICDVSIDRYLNAGAIYSADAKTRAKAPERAKRAQAAYSKIMSAIAAELKTRKGVPLTFMLGGMYLERMGIKRCFDGKGSPGEIRDVLWLASRFGHTSWEKAQSYCYSNLGLDCNGFVGNYCGLVPDNLDTILFDKNPRKSFDDIECGDIIIFYKTLPKSPKPNCSHVAVVGENPSVSGNTLDFTIVQSSGSEVGLNTTSGHRWTLKRDKSGAVYSEDTSSERRYRFFAAGPAKRGPR
ncbi:MAG: hypothetical protein L0Y72_18000 [Gemmataceae bacterium]|nr:hypothetical protein [Gemmataceae bacterium]MCI0740944.1 hypothetical protein [Gemmataceae bacterium]